MKLLKLFIIPVLILVFSVPWFFTKKTDTVILGFPGWAFYSLIASVVYSIVIALFLKRYWKLCAEERDERPGQ